MSVPLTRRLRDPIAWTGATQLVKTVVATVLAWVLAVHVFHIPQPFLAPWAALLTVHATVMRTVRLGLQQIAATVLGVLLAFAAGKVLGLDALSVGVVVLLGLVVGSVHRLRTEATTTAATALVVLTTGYGSHHLLGRLLDTGVGIAVGLLVNLVLWPPLHDRTAARRLDAIDDRLGELLSAIAGGLRRGGRSVEVDRWLARTGELDRAIEEASGLVGQARESGRLNPRRAASPRMRAAVGFGDILERLELAVAETRSMVRTVALARTPPAAWDAAFREPWLDLLERAGAAVTAGDASALTAVRADLERVAAALPLDELTEGFWPVSGALLVNLRNLLAVLDAVAEAQPVEAPLRPRRVRTPAASA